MKKKHKKTLKKIIAKLHLYVLAVIIGILLCYIISMTPKTVDIADDDEKKSSKSEEIALKPYSFDSIEHWQDNNFIATARAYMRSCEILARRDKHRSMGGNREIFGKMEAWQDICKQLENLQINDGDNKERSISEALTQSYIFNKNSKQHQNINQVIRKFFEENFTPYQIIIKATHQVQKGDIITANTEYSEYGKFTGYYEPQILASQEQSTEYATAIYAMPEDLVTVYLGDFLPSLAGRRIIGKIDGNNRLEPYLSRAQIDENSDFAKNAEILAWAKDPVSLFFLQIQGSGRLKYPDDSFQAIGYAGQNGHRYYAIGRELLKRGHLSRDNVNALSIMSWLRENPEEGREIMHTNPSYIFFRKISGESPIGAQNVVLEPEYSLAVDRKYIPLGAPLWLDVELANPTESNDKIAENISKKQNNGNNINDNYHHHSKLMVAQDIGGAIKGIIRGDIFFGRGERAEYLASNMNYDGKIWVLLPNELSQNLNHDLLFVPENDTENNNSAEEKNNITP